MKTPKWRKIVAEYQKIKNVSKVANKFKVSRGTVYSYLRLAEKGGEK